MVRDRRNRLLFYRREPVLTPYPCCWSTLRGVRCGCIIVKRIALSERAEAPLQIVDYCSWCVGVAAVCADAGSEVDVMVYYAGFGVGCVREVGFLWQSEHVSACC